MNTILEGGNLAEILYYFMDSVGSWIVEAFAPISEEVWLRRVWKGIQTPSLP